ncbi:MAG TPA: hypothetical protein VJB82_03870 [Candidatus Peribacterales bacterium]|nr:hypothetical protein [Candidatus Peribacterales bacterium]
MKHPNRSSVLIGAALLGIVAVIAIILSVTRDNSLTAEVTSSLQTQSGLQCPTPIQGKYPSATYVGNGEHPHKAKAVELAQANAMQKYMMDGTNGPATIIKAATTDLSAKCSAHPDCKGPLPGQALCNSLTTDEKIAGCPASATITQDLGTTSKPFWKAQVTCSWEFTCKNTCEADGCPDALKEAGGTVDYPVNNPTELLQRQQQCAAWAANNRPECGSKSCTAVSYKDGMVNKGGKAWCQSIAICKKNIVDNSVPPSTTIPPSSGGQGGTNASSPMPPAVPGQTTTMP